MHLRILALLSFLVVVGCAPKPTIPTSTPMPPFEGLQAPPGFVIETIIAPGRIGQPTAITFGPDGMLYTLTLWGKLYRIERPDNPSRTRLHEVFASNPGDGLNYAMGLAFYEGKTYVADGGRISILEDTNGDHYYDTISPIITGLVSLKYSVHSNNGIVFGPDGKLYTGVGAVTDRGPLVEPMEACILRMNPDGSDLEVYATGFRNPYDIAFSPDGKMFAPDNNPDGLDEPYPEEINLVEQGQHYGFPEIYETPELSNSVPPLVELLPSAASSGLIYYAADMFPEAYRKGLFLAQWGTSDEVISKHNLHNGRMIVFIQLDPLADGTLTASWEPFITQDGSAPDLWRPVDVTVGPDGALYVAEYTRGAIYRVTYKGESTR